jgi:beta-galactosidase/beta-glucuronidase
VWVNGNEIGMHRGGYDAFSFDITESLRSQGSEELVVSVWDPTEGTQPRGKQVNNPGGIWYTPITGIWQTVWLEPVPHTYLESLKFETDIEAEVLRLQVHLAGDVNDGDHTIKATVKIGTDVIATVEGAADELLEVPVENAQLWSPDSPFLYDLDVALLNDGVVVDEVTSYFGMRKIGVAPDQDGTTRLWLNNQPLFQLGLLDQGYWPDGLYTAPTDEALRYDIEVTRQLGFNLIRKHVKVEPARWYYWAARRTGLARYAQW